VEEHPEGVPVYNFQVEGVHNYFVLEEALPFAPLLVHNTECGGGASDDGAPPSKPSALKPGPHAKESIPGHRGRPTAAEQKRINELFERDGCHTCGTKDPGTRSGNAVADHQPPQALGEPKEFFPHCLNCARRQGGQVLQELLGRGG
jgi:hypothetical protein